MNTFDIIVIVLLAAAFTAVVGVRIYKRVKHKGGCGGCEGCGYACGNCSACRRKSGK